MSIPAELGIGGAFAIAVIGLVLGFLLKMKLGNGKSKPGSSPACIDHALGLAVQKNQIEGLTKELAESKNEFARAIKSLETRMADNFKMVFNKIDNLNGRGPGGK